MLSDYLGGLNEDLVKDNFVIVYEVSCIFAKCSFGKMVNEKSV